MARAKSGTSIERPEFLLMLHEVKKLKPVVLDFWLTGHLYCGVCGAQMSGVSANGRSGR